MRTGTGSPPGRGRTPSAVGCAPRCWRQGMACWGAGALWVRCSRRPAPNAAGSTRSPSTCCPRCRSPRTREQRRPWWRSGSAEDKKHAQAAVPAFADLYGTKGPKAVAKITDDEDELLRSTTSRPSAGSTCARPTPLSQTCGGTSPDEGDEGSWIEGRRDRDGIQADRSRAGTLARRDRAPPGRPVRAVAESKAASLSNETPNSRPPRPPPRPSPIRRSRRATTGA